MKATKQEVKQLAQWLGLDFDKLPYDFEEFYDGVQEEFEHEDITGGSLYMTGKIALAHLKENPKYYTILKKAMDAAKPVNEGTAADAAKKKGLTYAGWGKWADKKGTVVAKTVDDKLVPISDKEKKVASTKQGSANDKWNNYDGLAPELKEPKFDLPPGYRASAGVVALDDDGNVVIVEPKNHYGGYEHTFPKGGVEAGMNLQSTAAKEAFEESGLKIKIVDYLGDYMGDTSKTRYYIARVIGGSDKDFGDETQSVKRIPPDQLGKYLNRDRDKRIAQDLIAKRQGKTATPKASKSKDIAKVVLHQKIGNAKGTNPGGLFMGSDGVKRYVKFYPNEEHGNGEHMSNTIYNLLGIGAAKSKLFDVNGKQAFATDIVDNIGNLGHISHAQRKKVADKILDGFAADVLTANWDVVGLEDDNIVVDKSGNPVRIDNGSSFIYRAQGAKKPESLLDKITEFEGFADPYVNNEYATVFRDAGLKSPYDLGNRLVKQVSDIVKLAKKTNNWSDLVNATIPHSQDKDKIIQMLRARTKLLVDKAKQIQSKSRKTEQLKEIILEATTVAQVNHALDKKYGKNAIKFYKGQGYYYFMTDGDRIKSEIPSMYTPTLRFETPESVIQWVDDHIEDRRVQKLK